MPLAVFLGVGRSEFGASEQGQKYVVFPRPGSWRIMVMSTASSNHARLARNKLLVPSQIVYLIRVSAAPHQCSGQQQEKNHTCKTPSSLSPLSNATVKRRKTYTDKRHQERGAPPLLGLAPGLPGFQHGLRPIPQHGLLPRPPLKVILLIGIAEVGKRVENHW